MAIYGLSVSFDFVDILENTIEYNKNIVTDYVVVTKVNDEQTKKCCEKYNVKCFEMDVDRNKGEMINAALTYYYLKVPENRTNWFLIFDSDVLLPPDIKKYNLLRFNRETLYGCYRINLKNEEQLLSVIKGDKVNFEEAKKYWYRKTKGEPGIGYFQLFNRRLFYNSDLNKIERTDRLFKNRFKTIQELRTFVLHLGTPDINWKQRVEKKWRKVL